MTPTETRWEKSDQKLHAEEQISPVKAKQGRTGSRILAVLIGLRVAGVTSTSRNRWTCAWRAKGARAIAR